MKTTRFLSALLLLGAATVRGQEPPSTPPEPTPSPAEVAASVAETAAKARPPEPLAPFPPGPFGPPRVAVVLSGGGARGIAHVGALRALEEAGIPVDAIAANSMGAIVGAIYASGRDAKMLETVVRSMEWDSIFSGGADRRILPVSRRADAYRALAGVSFDRKGVRVPAGLLPEHRVDRFLVEYLAPAAYTAGGDFDRLPIPFRAVATDIGSGPRPPRSEVMAAPFPVVDADVPLDRLVTLLSKGRPPPSSATTAAWSGSSTATTCCARSPASDRGCVGQLAPACLRDRRTVRAPVCHRIPWCQRDWLK